MANPMLNQQPGFAVFADNVCVMVGRKLPCHAERKRRAANGAKAFVAVNLHRPGFKIGDLWK